MVKGSLDYFIYCLYYMKISKHFCTQHQINKGFLTVISKA